MTAPDEPCVCGTEFCHCPAKIVPHRHLGPGECDHEWVTLGGPGGEWQMCDLCGVEDES